MAAFNIAAMVLGILFLVLGILILSFRSKAHDIVKTRFAAAAHRSRSQGNSPSGETATVPGAKFVTFLGCAVLLIGGFALVLALTQ